MPNIGPNYQVIHMTIHTFLVHVRMPQIGEWSSFSNASCKKHIKFLHRTGDLDAKLFRKKSVAARRLFSAGFTTLLIIRSQHCKPHKTINKMNFSTAAIALAFFVAAPIDASSSKSGKSSKGSFSYSSKGSKGSYSYSSKSGKGGKSSKCTSCSTETLIRAEALTALTVGTFADEFGFFNTTEIINDENTTEFGDYLLAVDNIAGCLICPGAFAASLMDENVTDTAAGLNIAVINRLCECESLGGCSCEDVGFGEE